jgi:DNA mismatch repair protein MutS
MRTAQGNLAQGQLPFDAEVPQAEDDLRQALDELDPDSMTPREALAALYRLKDLDSG